MNRREILILNGTIAAIALAGCSSGGSVPDDPKERAEYLAREGADENTAWVDDVRDVYVGDSDDYGGLEVGVDYDLRYSDSDGPADAEENAAWAAYHIFSYLFEDDIDVGVAIVRGFIPTIDQQGNESEAIVSRIGMTGDTGAEIVWENIAASNVEPNADLYEFNGSPFR